MNCRAFGISSHVSRTNAILPVIDFSGIALSVLSWLLDCECRLHVDLSKVVSSPYGMAVKKILYLHASAELYGSDYVLLSLLTTLDKARYEPLVILPFEGPLCLELRKAEITYVLHDLPVLRRTLFTAIGLLKFAMKTLCSVWFLVRLISSKKVSVVHTNTSAIWVGAFAARFTRRPHYWQVMELVERPKSVSWMMRKMVGIFSTKVFCISEAVNVFFAEANPSRVEKFKTIYHGVNRTVYDRDLSGVAVRRKLGIPESASMVLFAGRFNAWKGQDVLANAIPEVCRHATDVCFVFLGSCFRGQEKYEEALRRQIDELVSDGCKVNLLGFQANLPEWLAAADVFVLPSRLPEPNATVTLAAMTMGLPVIGTNIGGTPEAVLEGRPGCWSILMTLGS